MAETFVVAFGNIGVKPVSGITSAREDQGLLITGRQFESYWAGPMTTGVLLQAEYAALYAQLIDGIERNLRFDFIHPRFRLPAGFTDATWPLEADPTLVEVVDLYTITVAGLETGMVLPRGTRLTLIQDELRCYRMLSAAVTVSSETVQSLSITPRLPMGLFEGDAAVRFKDPPVRLAVVSDSADLHEEYRPTPVTFEVEEALA